jgi:replication factor C subunit 3/5
MLWVDKYRPEALDRATFHKPLSARLKQLVATGDLPHLLMYGPSGAGKKTRVSMLLHELFGAGAAKVRVEHRALKSGSATVDLTTLASNHHIELNPSDVGNHDRTVVQQLIKEIAQSVPLDAHGRRAFKVVVVHEADRLSREAQQALRRTMEKYASTTRIVLVCCSTSKVIEPIRSRCLAVRVPAPTEAEVTDVLNLVSRKEGLQLPVELAARIARASGRNVRRAVLALEACKVDRYPFEAGQVVPSLDWEQFVAKIVNLIMAEQSPAQLLKVRTDLYELLANCIPPEVILKSIAVGLMAKIDSSLKYDVAHWAAHYEHRLNLGAKQIYHLEAFCAKFMALYKRFLATEFAMMDDF